MIDPYKVDPEKSSQENASAFLNWIVRSICEIHRSTEDGLKYQRATYEMVYRLSAARMVPAPQQSMIRAPRAAKIVRDFVIGNEDLVIRMLRSLVGK